jgi:hypothetical protein
MVKMWKELVAHKKSDARLAGGIVAFIREIELVANLFLLNAHNSTPCVH